MTAGELLRRALDEKDWALVRLAHDLIRPPAPARPDMAAFKVQSPPPRRLAITRDNVPVKLLSRVPGVSAWRCPKYVVDRSVLRAVLKVAGRRGPLPALLEHGDASDLGDAIVRTLKKKA